MRISNINGLRRRNESESDKIYNFIMWVVATTSLENEYKKNPERLNFLDRIQLLRQIGAKFL